MKKGIEYFPFDVDFFEDEKIQFVSARFGPKGEVCAIRLLAQIYRNGYFKKWDDDTSYLFSKAAGEQITARLANEVVNELVKRGFFDKSLFDSFGILTSRGIQRRYLDACVRRKSVEVDERYLLIDTADYKNLKSCRACSSTHSPKKCIHRVDISSENAYISGENVDISKESKVEESRVKESRVEESTPAAPTNKVQEAWLSLSGDTNTQHMSKIGELEELHGTGPLLQAIEIAGKRGVKTVSYIEAILRSWRKDGYDGPGKADKRRDRSRAARDDDRAGWDDEPDHF